MAKNKETIILPGEEITTEEEYAGGKNTYNQKGIIRSTAMGKAIFDENRKEVAVRGKIVQTIRPGDIVNGKVVMIKDTMVMLELKSAENKKKITSKAAMIPVRNVSTDFISDLHKVFKIGDLVKAKVTNASPLGIDLATNEKGLGVTKAYCGECRHEMSYSNGKLMCLSCGSVEERKWFEMDQKPREFNDRAPRRDFGERRSFGGRPSFNRNRGFGNRENGSRNFGGERRSFGEQRFGDQGRDNRFGKPRENFNKRF